MQRLILYSLRTVNEKVCLSIDLTGIITPIDNRTISLNLESGKRLLNVWDYLNKKVVFDDGKVFFLVANKQLSQASAFETLIEYAVSKLDKRIDHLTTLKESYKRLTAA